MDPIRPSPVLVAELIGELRAWPQDSWAKVGVDPDQAARPSLAAGVTAR